MCNKKVAKIILVVLNIIFFLIGAAGLGIGIFVLLDEDTILSTLGRIPNSEQTLDAVLDATSYLEDSAYILIAVGAVLFIIGFCGCCGALKENKCLLYIYAILVFLILAAEVAGVVIIFLYTDTVELKLQGFLNDTIKDKYEGVQWDGSTNTIAAESIEPYSIAWDSAMVVFECCGSNDYTDFKLLPATQWAGKYNVTANGNFYEVNAEVPITCCKLVDPSVFPAKLSEIEFVNITECLTTASSYATNQNGCYQTIRDKLVTYSTYVYGVGIAVALIEIIGLLAAICLIKGINDDDKEA